ncbi:hypothetical protein B0T26DRAFT_709264 [Lasiosphaeria miniovina]|uniref:5'-3' DNA helicase ZGRF1-like N-terminal domain-containing protein n=1 Tax=Lasiosphaeria miniovina TaxID=1954250 RepID=A0AA40DUU8_9PEZI|nr:uncharacterized protein B0T26DRAFT_709264 [Lasiosphaeria miniovina]KAK0717244.1 hypothetical protein B0T26DRAFT_709264 [Lasiosphaeria miniovina]
MPAITMSLESMAAGGVGQDGGSAASSAPVLEFQCLFTYDLRRKQKRWQDGRIRYHTFNKRVMAYDDRGNFVGDMHWRGDYDFDEGEEVKLERGGVIVQVAECVGRHDQDLSELLDKRVKEKEQRSAQAAARPARPGPVHNAGSVPRLQPAQDHFQTRHRPLHRLLGTPSRPYGRATVPTESPFEQRHNPNETPAGQPDTRPSKKRRCDDIPPSKMGYAQSLFGAPLILSGAPMSSASGPPARRPAAPIVRPRPETPSSQEELFVNQDQEPTPAPLQVSNYIGALQDSAEVAPTAGHLRIHPRRPIDPPLISRPPPKAATEVLDRSPPETLVAARWTEGNGKGKADSHTDHSSGLDTNLSTSTKIIRPSRSDETTPNLPKKHTMASSRDQLAQNGLSAERVLPRKTKLDEVIILDEDTDDGPTDQEPVMRGVTGSKRGAPDVENQRQAKRKKVSSAALSLPLIEKPIEMVPVEHVGARSGEESAPKEPRTELRLKSRQKRGLLMVSELASKPKRVKAQKQAARKKTNRKSPEEALEESLEDPAQDIAMDRVSEDDIAQQKPFPASDDFDDPFTYTPIVPKISRQPDVPQPIQKPQRTPQASPGMDPSDDGHFTFNISPRRSDQLGGPTTGQTKLAKSVYDLLATSDDEITNHSPSPPRNKKRLLSRNDAKAAKSAQGEGPKKAPKSARAGKAKNTGLDLSSSPEQQPSPQTRRQARNTRRLEETSLNATKRNRQCSEPQESTDEEMPQVPVGPRFARLGSRSVKSKEVIGYVVAVPPVTSTYNALNSRQGSLVDYRPAPVEDHPEPAIDDGKEVTNDKDDATSGAVHKPIQTLQKTARERSKPPSFPTTIIGAPSLQRHNSLPESRQNQDARDGDNTAPSVDIRLSRSGLVRHRSAVATTRSSSDESVFTPAVNAGPPVSGLRDVDPTEEAVSTMAPSPRPGDRQNMDSAGEGDSQSRLHKPSNYPESRQQPMNREREVGETSAAADRPISVPPGIPAATTAATTTTAAPIPRLNRITNPATRGRKAALKSHKAGQTPQSFLPPEVTVPAGRVVIVRVSETVRPETVPAVSERPKKKMTFPGFASAATKGGGPWSREAHDLLNMERPC